MSDVPSASRELAEYLMGESLLTRSIGGCPHVETVIVHSMSRLYLLLHRQGRSEKFHSALFEALRTSINQ